MTDKKMKRLKKIEQFKEWIENRLLESGLVKGSLLMDRFYWLIKLAKRQIKCV
jgi:hypothetical protein